MGNGCKVSGILPDLMDAIALAHNFTYVIHKGSDWGTSIHVDDDIEESLTSTGIFGDIVNGQ